MLIVDLSRAMDEKDLAPSRLQLTLTLLDGFLAEFFDQNPISQLGIVITRDAVARLRGRGVIGVTEGAASL